MIGWLVLMFLVVAGLLLLFHGDIQFLAGMGTLEIIVVAVAVVMILVYIMLLLSNERARPMQAIRYLLFWGVLGFALVAGYSYRDELSGVVDRVAGELVPPGQTMEGERAVRVRRRPDGHFVVRGAINGRQMMMLVDTGASSVVLRPSDATRAGVDTDNLNYNVAVRTANGTTFAAPVRLRSVTVGPLEFQDVEALVAQPGSLNENLLGMSFLRRLRSYEFSKDFLTLRG